MKSHMRRVVFRSVPIVLALCIALISAQKAFAWTHLLSYYPDYPTCGNTSSNPCLYWPEPNGVSTTIYALYDGISNVGPAHYDFTSTLSATFADFNGVQGAFNPYMYNCNYTGCQNAVRYTSAQLSALDYAVTDLTSSNWGPVQYGHGQYYAIFTNTTVTFNNQVFWNNSCQYGLGVADARKVARHETGHVQGLGHTGFAAIMKQGDVCFNPMKLQPNDILGLQTIYTGSITATTANG